MVSTTMGTATNKLANVTAPVTVPSSARSSQRVTCSRNPSAGNTGDQIHQSPASTEMKSNASISRRVCSLISVTPS